MSEISKDEFVTRFADELVRIVGPTYRDEDNTELFDTREYALEVGPTYFDEADQREDGPEECARVDFSYWEADQ